MIQVNHGPSGRTRIALLWRGDPSEVEKPAPINNRLYPLFNAFADLSVTAEPVAYADHAAEAIRDQLLAFDGVLVWVDPITDGRDRSKLDLMLADLSHQGVWVSAHPDVIQKIGTKEVLVHTRDLGWGTDTRLYPNARAFKEQFPGSLGSSGSRVLKQRRGNGGIGTWKVEMAGKESPHGGSIVRVREARRGSTVEELRLGGFMDRVETYFFGRGCLVDQLFQPRTTEGMIRCYLVHDEVVGFSTQRPRAPGDFAMAREKTMYESSEPRFAVLRSKMESQWVPALQELFDIATCSLPAIWDADFLYGAKDENNRDTYVLAEINVSAVLPFPQSAVEKIALASVTQILAARAVRGAKRSTPSRQSNA